MKTFFRRFSFIYLLIFLVAFGVIVVATRLLLERHFVERAKNQTVARLQNFETLVNKNGMNMEMLREQFGVIDAYMGSTTIIVDCNQDVQGNERNLKEVFSYDKEGIIKDYYRVLNGEIIAVKRVVLFEHYAHPKLRIGFPMTLHGSIYVIFVMIPFDQVEDTITRISIVVLLVLVFSGILALVFIYLMTKQISNELDLITRSANEIGSGAFDEKIKMSSTEELSNLAYAFNNMAKNVKHHEQARRSFYSSFSHDIRTPLTTIKGYSVGMLDGVIDKADHERYLKFVVSECDRILVMANDLLDLAKIESGDVGLSMEDFDLNVLMLNVLDSFEKIIHDKRIEVEIEWCHDKVLAHGDYSGIQRVVYNLLDNATKFVNEGGTISIKSELRGDTFYVGIGNTGRVLDDDEKKRIFNRFEKLDTSRGLGKSSGLGLAIVKEIVKAHNQKIDVYSNDEIGVVFIFTISAQIFKKE